MNRPLWQLPVEILGGAHLVQAGDTADADLPEILGDPPDRRWPCQAGPTNKDALVRLRIAGDEL